MRILLMTLYYYPDQGGTPGVYKDLCESLCSMGHDVVVVTGLPRYNLTHLEERYRRTLYLTERINGVEVRRITTLTMPRYFPAARAIDYFLTALALFFLALFTKRADIALVHSPTLFEGVASVVLRKLKHMPFVLNVHDIFPQTAIDLGMMKSKSLIRFFQFLESYVYKEANCVTVHSHGNREWIASLGGSPENVEVMPIWMNATTLTPGPRNNAWRHRQGLNDKYIVLFSGSQGYNQDMTIIIKAAERLRFIEDIVFVIVGDGAQHNEMVELSNRMQLNNVLWLDWQSYEEYPLVQQAADIVLATLNDKVNTPVVPSKILSAMSAGRPVIVSAPLCGDAPKVVHKANSGITLSPGDDRGLAESVMRLYGDRNLAEELGANGRAYVEEFLNVDRWAVEHIRLFSSILQKCEQS